MDLMPWSSSTKPGSKFWATSPEVVVSESYTQGSIYQTGKSSKPKPKRSSPKSRTRQHPHKSYKHKILQMSNLDRPLFVWLVFCVGTVWNLQGERKVDCLCQWLGEKKRLVPEVQAITPPTLCYSNSVALSRSVFCLIAVAAKVHAYN
jgi:hypothetical protein